MVVVGVGDEVNSVAVVVDLVVVVGVKVSEVPLVGSMVVVGLVVDVVEGFDVSVILGFVVVAGIGVDAVVSSVVLFTTCGNV